MTPCFHWWCWCSIYICPHPEPSLLSAGLRRFLWRSGPWRLMLCLWSAGPSFLAGLDCGRMSEREDFLLTPDASEWLHQHPHSCMAMCSSPYKHRTLQYLKQPEDRHQKSSAYQKSLFFQLLWSTMMRFVLSGACPVKPLYSLGCCAAAQFQGVGNMLLA